MKRERRSKDALEVQKNIRFFDQAKVFRWSGSIEAEESGSGGEAQAGTSIVGG